MKRIVLIGLVCVVMSMGADCENNSSDSIQRRQQETLLNEATAQVGMPAIKNFRERKMLKDILELRDQNGLTTYTYLFSEVTGKLTFLGTTVGYGIPYATQFTNPLKTVRHDGTSADVATIAQADPSGLFSPTSADGTWVLMLDPSSGKTVPQYIEPRIIVLSFKLADDDPRLMR